MSGANQSEALHAVMLFLKDQLKIANVQVDDDLLSKGLLTSLEVLELVHFVEEKFGIEVDPNAISPENFSTPNVIARFVSQSRTSGSA